MAELEWIAESLVQFARSPLWTSPVQNFVDDNCGVFNNESEMKLEYTVIHHEFRALIDRLLTCFLDELGVAPQQAIAALQKCASDDVTDTKLKTSALRLLKYLLSVDDFCCFHRLMVRRNVELDIAAYTELQRKGVISSDTPPAYAETPEEVPTDRAASARRVRDANGELDEDEAMRLAIEASLNDKTMAEKRCALEEAQVQEALALDACVKQRQLHGPPDGVPHETQHIVSKALRSQQPLSAQTSVDAQETSVEQQQQHHHAQQALACTLSAHTSKEQDIVTTHLAEAPQLHDNSATVATSDDANSQSQPSHPPASLNKPPAKPSSQFGLSALPPIDASSPAPCTAPPKQNNPCPAATPPSGTAAAAAAQTSAVGVHPETASAKPPTKEELEARARHMREQRERIVAQNRVARQRTLQEYANDNNVTLPNATKEREAAERKLTVDIARRLREDILDEVRRQ